MQCVCEGTKRWYVMTKTRKPIIALFLVEFNECKIYDCATIERKMIEEQFWVCQALR